MMRCENSDKNCYFNESHIQSYTANTPFSLEDACNEMTNFRNQINQWEQARGQMIQTRGIQ